MWAESTAKGGVKERRISSIFTLNFETKSILSDRAWVNLESPGIFFGVFLGFGYKITDKPRIPSDNLDPASMLFRINITNGNMQVKYEVSSSDDSTLLPRWTRHVFVRYGCPRWQQSQNIAKICKSTFWPHPIPRGMWCQWMVRNP